LTRFKQKKSKRERGGKSETGTSKTHRRIQALRIPEKDVGQSFFSKELREGSKLGLSRREGRGEVGRTTKT